MYYSNKDVRLEEIPKPKIDHGELLVKVMASGICGSDVMEWYRIKKAPLVLGHEIAGEIVEVGEDVDRYKKGQRVFVTHHVPCESCVYCANENETDCHTLNTTKFYPGGFSEYLRVPKINVEKGTLVLPDEIFYDEGTFVEPLGCVVRGQRKARIGRGQTVLVLGSGLAGLLHIQLAKAHGADKVIATDLNPFRMKMAKKLGADYVFDARENIPEKVKEVNEGRLADRVIICAAAVPVLDQAINSVDRGGTILLFAMFDPNSNLNTPVKNLWGITITSSYAAVKCDLEEAIQLLKEKKINVKDMITHRLGLAETGLGFQLVANAKDSMKVIIEPQR
jgi:L-iditol 2-dehydrogenase